MNVVATAWNESTSEMWKQVKPLLMLWPFFALAVLFFAVWFAVKDYEEVNALISFVAGLLTGAFYFLIGYGSLISFAFFTIFTHKVSKAKFERRISYTRYSHDEVHGRFWIYGALLTLLWVFPLFMAVSQIPVVGDQVAFMFRNQG